MREIPVKRRDGYFRFFDAIAAVASIVLLSPVFLLISLSIKTTSAGPVFFRQARLGRDGRPFQIFKFRTMIEGAEHRGLKMLTHARDERITRVGSFLRDWSIDELPQIINVLKGEMSLVGPRPAIMSYLKDYDEHQIRRLEVPPGITGWAQVTGRNSLTWPERIERDVWYVDHRSLVLNIKIILKTLPVVIRREGVYGTPDRFEMSSPAPGGPDAKAAARRCKHEYAENISQGS